MSAAHILPFLWAHEAAASAAPVPLNLTPALLHTAATATEIVYVAPNAQPQPQPAAPAPPPEIAFYRKYTEGLLRRYLRCSMEAGKVPSLLGKEMFRAKVSSYRMESFEDIIIFITDVEHCLARLDGEQQDLIARITLQEYTVQETAELLNLAPRTVVRRYSQALDRLTRIFLAVEMLHPQNLVKGVNRPNSVQVPDSEREKS